MKYFLSSFKLQGHMILLIFSVWFQFNNFNFKFQLPPPSHLWCAVTSLWLSCFAATYLIHNCVALLTMMPSRWVFSFFLLSFLSLCMLFQQHNRNHGGATQTQRHPWGTPQGPLHLDKTYYLGQFWHPPIFWWWPSKSVNDIHWCYDQVVMSLTSRSRILLR